MSRPSRLKPWENPLPEYRDREPEEDIKAYYRERGNALHFILSTERYEWGVYWRKLKRPTPEDIHTFNQEFITLGERQREFMRRERALRAKALEEAAHVRCA